MNDTTSRIKEKRKKKKKGENKLSDIKMSTLRIYVPIATYNNLIFPLFYIRKKNYMDIYM